MRNAIAKINRTIWELRKKVEEHPEDFEFRKDLLKFFHESCLFSEKRLGVPEDNRSFLLLQDRESLCCFLIHGAGGSPKEMRELGERLFKLGYTVYAISLPLSATLTDQNEIGEVKSKFRKKWGKERGEKRPGAQDSWSSCLSEAEIVLETLISFSPSTYMIGFSFGGTIALNLMRRHPVKGTILISPALIPVKTFRYLIFQLMRKVLPTAARNLARREDTIIELMGKTRRGLAEPIEQLILVIQASNDPVISSKGFKMLKRSSVNPGSNFVMLDSRRHVLVNGEELKEIFRLCTEFIKGN